MISPIIIVGAGSGSSSVLGVASDLNHECLGFYDPYCRKETYCDLPVLKSLDDFSQSKPRFICGIGDNKIRKRAVDEILLRFGRESFPTIIHPSAQISKDVKFGVGNVIMPNVCVGAFSKIGDFCLLNTATSIDHENVIGNFCVFSPRVTTAGCCQFDDFVTVGMSASIKENIRVDYGATIGACSFIKDNVGKNELWFGVPGRFQRSQC